MWEKVNIKEYQSNCAQLLESLDLDNNDSPEEVLQSLQNVLSSATHSCAPTKRVRSCTGNLQQLNPDLVSKIQTNKAINKELKEAKENYPGNDACIRRLTEKCKRAKKILISQQRQDAAKKRKNKLQDIMDAHASDQKLFYKLISEQHAS